MDTIVSEEKLGLAWPHMYFTLQSATPFREEHNSTLYLVRITWASSTISSPYQVEEHEENVSTFHMVHCLGLVDMLPLSWSQWDFGIHPLHNQLCRVIWVRNDQTKVPTWKAELSWNEVHPWNHDFLERKSLGYGHLWASCWIMSLVSCYIKDVPREV